MLKLFKTVNQKLSQAYNKFTTPPSMDIYQKPIDPMPDISTVINELMLVYEDVSPHEMNKIVRRFKAKNIHNLSQSNFVDIIKTCRMVRGKTVLMHPQGGLIVC